MVLITVNSFPKNTILLTKFLYTVWYTILVLRMNYSSVFYSIIGQNGTKRNWGQCRLYTQNQELLIARILLANVSTWKKKEMLNVKISSQNFIDRGWYLIRWKNFSNLPYLNGYETRNSFSNWFLGQRLLSNKRHWKFYKGTNDDLRYEFFYM